MAQGSQLETSCNDPDRDKFHVPTADCARDNATISACAIDSAAVVTRLTPTDISSPVSSLTTTAPNGPPVC